MAEENKATKKNPKTAVLISILGTLFLFAPGIGYLYLGDVGSAATYILGGWFLLAIIIGIFTVVTAFVGPLGLCCFGLFPFFILWEAFVVWGVYLRAKGEKPRTIVKLW